MMGANATASIRCFFFALAAVMLHRCDADARSTQGANLLSRRTGSSDVPKVVPTGNSSSAVPPGDCSDDEMDLCTDLPTCAMDEMDLCEMSNNADHPMLISISVCEMLVRDVSRMTAKFLLVAYPYDPAENKVEMNHAIDWYDAGLNDLINGNKFENIPAPTNGEVKKELAKTKLMWDTYKTLLVNNVDTVKATSVDVLQQVHVQSQALKDQSEIVLERHVAFAVINAHVDPIVRAYARRALLYLETIIKEALWISLNVEVSYYLKKIRATEYAMKDVEHTLLYGNAVAGVPELSQFCILEKMLQVHGHWTTYRNLLAGVQDTRSIGNALLHTLVPAGVPWLSR